MKAVLIKLLNPLKCFFEVFFFFLFQNKWFHGGTWMEKPDVGSLG